MIQKIIIETDTEILLQLDYTNNFRIPDTHEYIKVDGKLYFVKLILTELTASSIIYRIKVKSQGI